MNINLNVQCMSVNVNSCNSRDGFDVQLVTVEKDSLISQVVDFFHTDDVLDKIDMKDIEQYLKRNKG